MGLIKKVASVFAMLSLSASELSKVVQAADTKGKESERKTLVYSDPVHGTLSMTYYTYQDTELGLPLSYLKGKIELQDKGKEKMDCDPNDIVWPAQGDPYCGNWQKNYIETKWDPSYQLRIGIEFGKPEDDKYKKHREQLRFIRHMDAPRWDSNVQSVTLFETAWDAEEKKQFYKFLTLPEDDNEKVDRSGKIGFTVDGGTLDIASKTATIEFTRPFDVSRDDSLTLEGGQKKQMWLQWGIFTSKTDDNQVKVKGMRSYVQKGGSHPDHPGVVWEIQVPPPAPAIAGSSIKSFGFNMMLTTVLSSAYFLFQ